MSDMLIMRERELAAAYMIVAIREESTESVSIKGG